MEQEKINTPEPLRASVTLHGDLIGSISATAQLGPVPKPPWYRRLKDRNLQAAKAVLKAFERVGRIGYAVGGWKILSELLGFKRQPAEARQV